MSVALALASLLAGCAPAPESFAQCAQLAAPDTRTVCRIEHIGDIEQQQVLDQANTIADPLERDMLLVELAVADPRNQGWLCKQVRHDYGARKCQQVLGRPHLSAQPKPQGKLPPQRPAP